MTKLLERVELHRVIEKPLTREESVHALANMEAAYKQNPAWQERRRRQDAAFTMTFALVFTIVGVIVIALGLYNAVIGF